MRGMRETGGSGGHESVGVGGVSQRHKLSLGVGVMRGRQEAVRGCGRETLGVGFMRGMQEAYGGAGKGL